MFLPNYSIIFFLVFSIRVSALRILGLFPYPAISHFKTGRMILEKLAELGHSVDVVSHFPKKKPISNYRDISLAGLAPGLRDNLTFYEVAIDNPLEALKGTKDKGRSVCHLLGKPILQEIMKQPKGTYDIIMIESFRTECFVGFGRQLGAPVIGIVSTKFQDWLYEFFGNPLNPSYMTGVLSKFSRPMTFWQRLQNTLLIKNTIATVKAYSKEQIAIANKYFDHHIADLKDLYDGVAMVLVNEHASISDVRPTTPDIVPIGGLHVDHNDEPLSEDLQNWLNQSADGCVYVSLGSLIRFESFPSEILDMFYKTFEKLAPVRVLLKVSDLRAVAGKLASNVKALTWIPQVSVLKHENVKVFVTHGGLLSTQEAVAYKVPMIGLSIFGDQHDNMQNYVSRGMAIHLDYKKLSVECIFNAITTILNDPSFRTNANRVAELFRDRPMSPLDTAVYWVEFTARHGAVFRSPATKLTWWQFYLLDVYGFILLCLVLMIYVTKIALHLLWKHAFSYCLDAHLKKKKNQ